MLSPPWLVCQSILVQPSLDPGGGVEQGVVAETRADQLDAERQPFAPGPRGQGHARRPSEGPDRVEARVAGRTEPLRRLADRTRRQQHVEFAEERSTGCRSTASSTPRISATSSRLRQITPKVSRLWHCILIPTRLNSPKLGL